MVAGGVATQYLNDLLPNLGDAVNWGGAVAMMSAGDPLAMVVNGSDFQHDGNRQRKDHGNGRPNQGVRSKDWARACRRPVDACDSREQ